MINSFSEFLLERYENRLSASDIVAYVTEITPDSSDIPDYSFMRILRSGKDFKLKKVDLRDLMRMDKSFEEYVLSGEDRYEDEDMDRHDLAKPIVVFDGDVIDGYNRSGVNYREGNLMVDAYVSG